MKKKYLFGLSIMLVIALLSILYGFFKSSDEGIKEFENVFNQNLPKGIKSIKTFDNYSSVPFEGEKLYSFQFTEAEANTFLKEIKSSKTWNALPLFQPLKLLMFGGTKDKIEYSYNFANIVGLPDIQNGYWISTNNNSDLLNSNSFNFSLAIFDSDNNMMYLFKIDT